MTVYIAIQEIELDMLELEIDDLCQFLQRFTTDYNHPIAFNSIRLKNVSRYRPNIGKYEEKWYITGVRKETPEEFDLRLLKIKEDAAKELELKEKECKIKKNTEYKKYLKLKKQYEGGNK
jgi:hypothetical protein